MRSFFMLILASILFACGQEGGKGAGEVKYYLAQAATSTISNSLILEVEGDFKPNFSVRGKGFTSSVEAGVSTAFQKQTELTAETFGEVAVEITLYQENGKPYLVDTLIWKSSGEVPPLPSPYFSEIVSADAYVYLVFPNKLLRGKNTTEVWLEGDLSESPEGHYETIPSDDQVLVKLSDADGMKTVRVKYRNIFGAHSALVTLMIEKKSVGPKECKAQPIASKTASGTIRTRIEAINEGPLYYKVTGDVDSPHDFVEFTDVIEEYIVLKGAEGSKRLTVQIKDQAGNVCPAIPLSIDYDRSYVPGKVTVLNDLLWTDSSQITLLPRYDQFTGDHIEMLITGGVIAGANTFHWIPYSESVPIDLSPTNGTRHVLVQFRRDQTPMLEVTTAIFLKPYVIIQGAGPPYQVIPGNILGTEKITLIGCLESYTNVSYQDVFPCSPTVSAGSFTIDVTYYLKDGTSLTRSATH
ncbi:MAG: hypothetical protein EOP10_10060 [Proteobacteria bacterium]|nr:MAG: hypothetical protein EOP10_10060 [Pseudomonadota bacterium]